MTGRLNENSDGNRDRNFKHHIHTVSELRQRRSVTLLCGENHQYIALEVIDAICQRTPLRHKAAYIKVFTIKELEETFSLRKIRQRQILMVSREKYTGWCYVISFTYYLAQSTVV